MGLRVVPGPVLVVGTGPRAGMVVEILRQQEPPVELAGLIAFGAGDARVGASRFGLPILDRAKNLSLYRSAATGAIAVAETSVEREEATARIIEAGFTLVSAIHLTAHVDAGAWIDDGAIVGAGCVLSTGTRVGRAAWLGAGSVLEHHAHVGDFTTVGTHSTLGANARVGERVEVGLGVVVRNEILIGPDATIGHGALVVNDVEAGTAVAGAPARPLSSSRDSSPPSFDLA